MRSRRLVVSHALERLLKTAAILLALLSACSASAPNLSAGLVFLHFIPLAGRSGIEFQAKVVEGAPINGNRHSRTIDVREFGARGDGITDDTEAFNRAIELAAPVGGKVRVPKSAHCYLVTEILGRSGVTLSGEGPSDTCIRNLARPGISLPLFGTAHTADAVTGQTIENLTLDGNRYAQSAITGDGDSDCIFLRGPDNTTLRNLIVKDCYTDGIYITGSGPAQNVNGNGVLIDHVHVGNSRRNNMTIICGDNIRIRASSFTGANGTAPESGIDIEPNAAGQTTSGVSMDAGVVLSDNRGAGLSIFNQFQNQPSMNLAINGSFLRNVTAAVNIISTRPYEIGGLSFSGTFNGNGAKSRVSIGIDGAHDVVIDRAQVSQDGTALRFERSSRIEILRAARLRGTVADLYVGAGMSSPHIISKKSLVNNRISGFACVPDGKQRGEPVPLKDMGCQSLGNH